VHIRLCECVCGSVCTFISTHFRWLNVVDLVVVSADAVVTVVVATVAAAVAVVTVVAAAAVAATATKASGSL
jgi:hypothetical protein